MISKLESKFVTLSALDLRKAFDCVNHKILLTKLTQKFNFHQNAFNLIQKYLVGGERCYEGQWTHFRLPKSVNWTTARVCTRALAFQLSRLK